jgi:aminoglycoside phosphotransferase family enzyme
MHLDSILRDLLDPRAHPGASSTPVLVQTHASAVVLAGDDVYKLKKPVDFGFLDYSTLARRKAMCEAEVALNRRLAPGVYLGVVAITERDGRAVLGGQGEPIEYAVHMRRLPEAATLAAQVRNGPVEHGVLERIGRELARFHASARRGPDVASWAAFDRVRENCRDNFAGLAPHAGALAPIDELLRLELETEAELDAQRSRIERRAREGVPCETHGDLRLEHVYLLETGELAIVDCIEFSPRYSCADPVSDVAFLAMDLRAHGAWPEARALLEAYFAASDDRDGRALVPLYVAYRSAVRAKVRALQATAPGIPPAERERAFQLARAHVQLAVGELATPGERPCLVLVGGLPGTGKSVLSGGLAGAAGLVWLRADAIRKELAGLDPLASGRSEVRAGIYTPSGTTEPTVSAWSAPSRSCTPAGACSSTPASRRSGVGSPSWTRPATGACPPTSSSAVRAPNSCAAAWRRGSAIPPTPTGGSTSTCAGPGSPWGRARACCTRRSTRPARASSRWSRRSWRSSARVWPRTPGRARRERPKALKRRRPRVREHARTDSKADRAAEVSRWSPQHAHVASARCRARHIPRA